MAKEILKMDLDELNKGVWDLILNYKNKEFDLSKYCFKGYFTVLQHLELMKNNKYFCIEYEMNRGCSTKNCTPPENIKEFFSPSINFNEEHITQYNIVYLLDALFSNSVNYCTKCQWKDGKINTNSSPKYYKNYISITPPIFMFFTFEDNLNEEFTSLKNTNILINAHDVLMFQKIKKNLNYIEYILVNEFEIFGCKYEIRGIITQPYAGHYNAIIINVKEPTFLIDKEKNYYYDDNKNNNEIIEIADWKTWIKTNIPILAIYEKIR